MANNLAPSLTTGSCNIALVIPCYRVRAQISNLLGRIGPEAAKIYVIDDCCPEKTGAYVAEQNHDPRITILTHAENQGVGGAVITGYRRALAEGADVIVKLDGDGQMDPALLSYFIAPIIAGQADYTKGNRFFRFDGLHSMPGIRLFGNAVLSFMTKLSSGYWTIFDPTNGYTAIHAKLVDQLPLDLVSKRYFFESDMLFRLNTLRARVIDIPMAAHYETESSNLRVGRIVLPFLAGHLRNFAKRIIYNYVLRDFSLASLELGFGLVLMLGGGAFGLDTWLYNAPRGITTSSGTVMLAALPIILGLQLILSFLGYDIAAAPNRAIHPSLPEPARRSPGQAGAPPP